MSGLSQMVYDPMGLGRPETDQQDYQEQEQPVLLNDANLELQEPPRKKQKLDHITDEQFGQSGQYDPSSQFPQVNDEHIQQDRFQNNLNQPNLVVNDDLHNQAQQNIDLQLQQQNNNILDNQIPPSHHVQPGFDPSVPNTEFNNQQVIQGQEKEIEPEFGQSNNINMVLPDNEEF